MLGRALDAADEQQQQLLPSDSENNSLATGTGPLHDEYGSITAKSEADISEDYTFGDEDDDEEDEEERENKSALCNFMWKNVMAIRSFIVLVANVDNLWDSPTGNRRSKRYIVFFWFTSLAVAYAMERTTFKLFVDRTGPFRLFSALVLTSTHALILLMGMMVSKCVSKNWKGFKSLGIPIVDVGLMALIDTAHLLLVVLSGSHVPPTLIVILVQLTIPLTGLFTQFVHPDGCCSRSTSEVANSSHQPTTAGRPIRGCGGMSSEHIVGNLLISLAVLMGLLPAVISFFEPEIFITMDVMPRRTALNTFLFTFACVPAAASQLYKEYVFIQHKQPVDADQFNMLLSVFQFIFLLIISPLVYGLQGLGAHDNWTSLYPSAQISQNFKDGLACLLGNFDEEKSTYPEESMCDYSLLIILGHVMSIITIGVAVDKIVNAGATKIMYRGMSAGIILAVLALFTYDMHDPDFNYGPVIDSLMFICAITLILGAEVYHRVSLQDATFETVYPQIDNLYDDSES